MVLMSIQIFTDLHLWLDSDVTITLADYQWLRILAGKALRLVTSQQLEQTKMQPT